MFHNVFYKFDKQSLTYIPTPVRARIVSVILFLLLILALWWNLYGDSVNQQPSEKELRVLIEQTDVFTKEKFIDYLNELNVKFPEIVYAQAVLETGNFQSEVFKANKNLFGMKEAATRATTNHGTNLNHAVYHHWRESVLDYALYQCSYLSDLNTESDYYNYLSQHYAEDKTYVSKVKEIASKIQS